MTAQLAIADVELSADKVIQLICDYAKKLTGADGAVIERYDGRMSTFAAAAFSKQVRLQMRIGSSESGLAFHTGKTFRVDDYRLDSRVDTKACRRVGVRSIVSVPLRRNGAVLGVLEVLAASPGRFSDADQAALELLAAPFGAALFNAHQLETTSRKALTDPLTGLANRAVAMHELEQALIRQARHGGHVAVATLTWTALRTSTTALATPPATNYFASLPPGSRLPSAPPTPPRAMAGDQFIVVCEGGSYPTDIEGLADRLLRTLPGNYQLSEGTGRIGASIGIAIARTVVSAEQLVSTADHAMYEAKRTGGNSRTTRLVNQAARG